VKKKLALLSTFALTLLIAATAFAETIRLAHVDPAEWTSSKKGAATLTFKKNSGGRIGWSPEG